MESVSLVLKITDAGCFKRKDVVKLIEKLSQKYGFTFVRLKGDYIITPNLAPLLNINNLNIKYSALLKYVSMLRFLISKNCVKIVKVLSNFEYKKIVSVFVNFLNNGVSKDGLLWYGVSHSIFDGMNVHRVIVNDEYSLGRGDFDDAWFKSNFRDVVRMIKVNKGDKCCFIVQPIDGVDFFINDGEYELGDLHIMALLKLAGLNILKKGDKKIDYIDKYSKYHPMNVLVGNVNRNLLGVEESDKHDIDISYSDVKLLNSNVGMNKTVIAKSIKYPQLCDCLRSNCNFVNWDDIRRFSELFSSLVLIKEVKEELTNTVHQFVWFRNIDSNMVKNLLYPDSIKLFKTIVKVVCDDFLPSWGKDKSVNVTFYHKFFDGTSEPYFVGLNIKSSDSVINYWFEVFNYYPITTLSIPKVYYNNGRFIKFEHSSLYTKSHVIDGIDIKQPKKVIKGVVV